MSKVEELRSMPRGLCKSNFSYRCLSILSRTNSLQRSWFLTSNHHVR